MHARWVDTHLNVFAVNFPQLSMQRLEWSKEAKLI